MAQELVLPFERMLDSEDDSSKDTLFQTALYERQRTLMAQEVVALREELIGSAAAVRILLKGGDVPECLHEGAMRDLTDYETGPINLAELFLHISIYVAEASWGETALRWNKVLPAVSKRFDGSVTAALKASTPDWKAFWGQAEEHRKKESPTATSDEKEWRAQLQSQLDLMNEQFVSTVEEELRLNHFPQDCAICMLPQAMIDKVLREVKLKPLSPELLQEAQDASAKPSLALLEAYRSRGEELRGALVNEVRTRANALFARAAKMRGQAQADAYGVVLHLYDLVTSCTLQADVVNCNAAAVALILKNFTLATGYGEGALEAQERRLREPITYEEKRANAVLSLHTGLVPPQPAVPHRARTEADIKADNQIRWKALIRLGRAQAGSVLEDLKRADGEQKDTDGYIRLTKVWFRAAHDLDPSDKTPLTELEAFERLVEAQTKQRPEEAAAEKA